MIKAAEVLKSKGATEIYVFATHGIFSSEFYQRVQESDITKVFVTNNLKSPAEELEKESKVQRIPISKLFADHIYKTCMGSP
jgi:ribose-phosphate pyrophosphokinase